jgi:hypothetical protein
MAEAASSAPPKTAGTATEVRSGILGNHPRYLLVMISILHGSL